MAGTLSRYFWRYGSKIVDSMENIVLKSVPVRLSDELHHEINMKIARERVPSFQQLTTGLLERWVKGEEPTPVLNSTETKFSREIAQLVEILSSGEAPEIRVLRGNLDMFSKAVRMLHRRRELGLDRP